MTYHFKDQFWGRGMSHVASWFIRNYDDKWLLYKNQVCAGIEDFLVFSFSSLYITSQKILWAPILGQPLMSDDRLGHLLTRMW